MEVGDVFKEVYNALNEDGVFIFDVHSTYQTDEVFPGYSYHENAEDFAMLWDTYEDAAPHSIVHELTFFIQRRGMAPLVGTMKFMRNALMKF